MENSNYLTNESLFTKIKVVAWRTNRFLSDRIGSIFSTYVLSDFEEGFGQVRTFSEAFDFSQDFKSMWYNIRPMQRKVEFTDFIQFLKTRKNSLRSIMEIGTGKGGTLFLFSQVAGVGGTVLSLDNYTPPKWKKSLFLMFSNSVRIKLVSGNSSESETVEAVNNAIKPEKLDLLFIDANHTYQGVKNDFDRFAPFVKDGGIVAFHDIIPGPGNGVPLFYNELRKKYESFEFKQRTYGWGGIGIIIYK